MKKPNQLEGLLFDLKTLQEKNHSSLSIEDLEILERLVFFLENLETDNEAIDGKAEFVKIIPDVMRFILNPEIWKFFNEMLDSFKNL